TARRELIQRSAPRSSKPDAGRGSAVAQSGDIYISFYTQHADGTLDLDIASSRDRGKSFPFHGTSRVSGASFALPPTNIPLPVALNPYQTTNYDRNITQCYALGEYQSARSAHGLVYALWGDSRNTVRQP